MANKLLIDAEILEIIDDDELWDDFEEKTKSGKPSTSRGEQEQELHDSYDRRMAIQSILITADERDYKSEENEEFSEHDSESEVERDPSDGVLRTMSRHNNATHSGLEDFEEEDTSIVDYREAWYGKDRLKLSKNAPIPRKTLALNIIKVLLGLRGPARETVRCHH